MNNIENTKSIKTLERIQAVEDSLESHKKNIDLLDAYADGRLVFKITFYPDINMKYKRRPEDEERYRWTRQIIKTQIAVLERELEVLNEYGA